MRCPHRPGIFAVSVAVLSSCLAPSGLVAAERPMLNLNAGQQAYVQHCARCHGVTGAGDGLDAKRFYPRPRDLSLGVYKFRSTTSGTPPTDADLFDTLTTGLPGSNMPDWQHLSDETRWHLVDYLKSLSTVFDEIPPEPVVVTADPGPKGADLAKGYALYDTLRCALCHGVQGRANGGSAAGLVDDWGLSIRPANLTQGWGYRGGSDARSIMLRFLSGIDGAGMPSYLGAITPEEAWHLAYYVQSLQEPAHWNLVARGTAVDGTVPVTLDDPRWAEAEWTHVRLRNVVRSDGTWTEAPTLTAVAFQVLHADEAIAFRLRWDDPTEDAGSTADALAVVLKPEATRGDAVTLQTWPYADAPALDLCVWSAADGQAREGVAKTYGLDAGSMKVGALLSEARYEDGRWELLIRRPLAPTVPAGAAGLRSGQLTSLAVAAWDGATPGVRAVSPWVDLRLSAARPDAETH